MSVTPPATTAREPVKVVADALQAQMGLADDALVLDYQKNFIPKTEGLYISIQEIGARQIGKSDYIDTTDPASPLEVQTSAWLHMIQIELISYDGSARARKEEVPMALGSIFSRQNQEKYSMQIAPLTGPPTNTSRLEETGFLNGFAYTVNVSAVHRLVRGPSGAWAAFNGELSTDPAAPGQPIPFAPAQLT